ncbi:hypothetical protein HCBG_08031 [Histoplasma capsulatum G186AR]|uniref:Uncharacterized protein n=1 Tax=Ajellomyces capsulatus (strain G186AR / H82 / ATCC MYA-2454 / RMSCC 2432) TaxID=447093 RepID=C0NX39_AJECG|nr:uncharacterized protein HCBG_08031 [Histoplasma capsulatum G186AR]EEH03905.1 hypothetical protein HCBG_08031 [Histoplasma capsulatum G186AR]
MLGENLEMEIVNRREKGIPAARSRCREAANPQTRSSSGQSHRHANTLGQAGMRARCTCVRRRPDTSHNQPKAEVERFPVLVRGPLQARSAVLESKSASNQPSRNKS